MIEMDLQQARYEASLAERRYAACDPENRLIAAQLERNWEATLRRVETCEARLSEVQRMEPVDANPDFTGLAQISKPPGMRRVSICAAVSNCCARSSRTLWRTSMTTRAM
ncbi:hypothetical protein [Mesorhizobium sp.]|uniref:hypothetical protein n=1 Tax=Mesorhizobium sp. TaxID=1871066 RepID=UPI001AEEE172|nr:hypothetical protein [Mesorhizobium sp.]